MANRKGKKGKGILAFVFCIPLVFILYFWIIYSSKHLLKVCFFALLSKLIFNNELKTKQNV
jgi:hypothetical protein